RECGIAYSAPLSRARKFFQQQLTRTVSPGRARVSASQTAWAAPAISHTQRAVTRAALTRLPVIATNVAVASFLLTSLVRVGLLQQGVTANVRLQPAKREVACGQCRRQAD